MSNENEEVSGTLTGTFNFNFKAGLPGAGVTNESFEEQPTIREFLEGRGIDVASVSLMLNGSATTLDAVIGDGDVVIAGRDGKGA